MSEEAAPNPNVFTCSNCGEVFQCGISDKEALAAYARDFGESPPEEKELVCDPCFKKIMAWLVRTN